MSRNKHTLSHYRLTTGDLGEIIPVGQTEVLPGDTVQHNASTLVRFSPMAAPVMHQFNAEIRHYFVPHRLVFPEWEEFITGGDDGLNADTVPTITTTSSDPLLDAMGIPPVTGIDVSALPVRGYNMIINEHMRDQDLTAERLEDDVTIAKAPWKRDYFTGARPWAQKGTAVTMPLGEKAPVAHDALNSTDLGVWATQHSAYRKMQAGGTNVQSAASTTTEGDSLYADLSSATAATITDFREALGLQSFVEARAKYGSRYFEYLRYLGVVPEDMRLQRPEFLGGGRVNVSVSEVLQTAPDADATSQEGLADMYGHGIAALRGNTYRRSFREHGYIHTVLCIKPEPIYQNGIPRHWLRVDKEDFWQKELERIGQQEVLLNEVWADATNGGDTFGFANRYEEYRRGVSQVCREFRGVLDYWHAGRQFASAPALNETFVTCDPDKRIFLEQTQHSLWMAVQHQLVARRLVGSDLAPLM